jgi:glutamine cyclotransferase
MQANSASNLVSSNPYNCLNGIAYYGKNGTFWITGKFWDYFWEVQFL